MGYSNNMERCRKCNEGANPLVKVYSSAAKHNLNVDSIGNLDPHELPEGTLVGIQIDESLVNAHFPAIPSLASLSVGALPARNLKLLGRKWDGSADVNASSLGDSLDLGADTIDLCRVGSAERDSCAL